MGQHLLESTSNQIRGCDTKGCGGYNQPRGARRHGGVDVVCEDGSTVHALFTGRIDGRTRPYGNAIDDGVQLSREGTQAKAVSSCWGFTLKKNKYL
uniref:Uncharacterized protein n=1 Tax=Nothoprocta perdicaria TaxID=30464 RepID=A0A8C6ZCX2_NOTPE